MRGYYCDHFVLPLPNGHRFPMAKYARLRELVVRHGIIDPAELHEAMPARWEDLALVHTAAYLHDVERGTLSQNVQRRIRFPWSPQMVERARRSVGATIQAAQSALSDGAAAIFAGDAAVFTFSMHGAHNFPFRKETSDLDLTLEDGARDAEYLTLLAEHLPRVLDTHDADIVFYVSGADPYEGDRLGRLELTIEGLRRRDAFVFESCCARRIPVAVTMAGGYAADVEAIATIHSNTIAEAARAAWSTLRF